MILNCDDKKCVFHNGKFCILGRGNNFFVENKNGKVVSCVNRIYNKNELSKEGLLRLKALKKTYDRNYINNREVDVEHDVGVAKYVVRNFKQHNRPITAPRLNIILYFIQRHALKNNFLVLLGEFVAGEHSPRLETVLQHYSPYGTTDLTTYCDISEPLHVNYKVEEVVNGIISEFYDMSYQELMDKVQRESGSWKFFYKTFGKGSVIPKQKIIEMG